MSTFVTAAFRDLTCVVAATLITVVAGLAFVQSTASPPGQARAAISAPLHS